MSKNRLPFEREVNKIKKVHAVWLQRAVDPTTGFERRLRAKPDDGKGDA